MIYTSTVPYRGEKTPGIEKEPDQVLQKEGWARKATSCGCRPTYAPIGSRLQSFHPPCGALSRFEKSEINAPINTIQYNTIQYLRQVCRVV